MSILTCIDVSSLNKRLILAIIDSLFESMWASLVAQLLKNSPAMQETPLWFLYREDPLERDRLPTLVFLGFPCGSAGKESACNTGDLGSIPGVRRAPREEKGYPFRYSGLENSMDCTVHGVAKSQTRLSDFHFPFLSELTEVVEFELKD